MVSMPLTDFARENLFIILMAIATIILALLIVFIEIRLKRKMKEKSEKKAVQEKTLGYIEQIKSIKNEKKPEKAKLNELSLISKNFFQEYFSISKNISYSELIENFTKMKKYDYIDFCREMLEEYYLEKEVTAEKIETLSENLINIIYKEQKILPDADKIPAPVQPTLQDIKNTVEGRKIPELPKINESRKIDESLKSELNKFIASKKEAQKIINKFYSDKKIMELSRKKITLSSEAQKILNENPELHNELRNLSVLLGKSYSCLNSLITLGYKKGDLNTQKAITALIKEWQREKEKIFLQAKNPIKQHMIYFHLIDKYFVKFMRTLNNNQNHQQIG